MKTLLVALALISAPSAALATDAETPKPLTAAQEAEQARQRYAEFLSQVIKPENVADLVSVMDKLVDQGEHGLIDKEPDPGMVEAITKIGLHFEFSATEMKKQAVVYFLKISRGGDPLRYDDATKFAAFFTDRAGLPHPIEITEGDRSTFTIRWIIKPSEWKKFRKQMTKVRAENRAEKDLAKAFMIAVQREIDARAAAQRGRL